MADTVPDRASHAPLVPATPRGEATRRRLLDAAEEVFGEMGYYEASVAEITRRAGVAQGTFYIYFHSKRETFVELVGDIGDRLRRAMSAASRDAASRVEAERLGFEAFFQFVFAHRRIYRIVEEAGRVAPEAAREYYQRISRGYEHGLAAAMREGQIHSGDVEGLAYTLMGIGHFLALRWIIWPSEEEVAAANTPVVPERIFESVMNFIARGLAPDGQDEAHAHRERRES